ncbi:MAG: hypothetical protein ACHQHN_08090 [Sphingobacteriales bacterium]
MDIDFQQVLQSLKQGIIGIAEKDLKDYVTAATADGQAILRGLEGDLENWTKQLAAGGMNKSEFTDLVLGQKDEIELAALKQAGLAQIAVDQFKQDTFNLITNAITALIP